MYKRDAYVIVQPFTRQLEGEDVIIGRIETGVFLAVPPEAVELLEHFAQGKSVGEVSDLYQQQHGEVPDLDDFLGLLETKGIVKPFVEGNNTTASAVPSTSSTPQVRYHFSNFPHRLAQHLFSPSALVGYFTLIALALITIVRDPWLTPGPRDLYFPDHRTLSWTLLIVAGYATIFIHEFAHLVAARAVGINSRLGITNRLWYLVAETDLTGLWSLPKQQRYMPMLAGMLIDAVSASLFIFLLFAYRHAWIHLSLLWLRLLRAMAFNYLLRLVWQFLLFIRTDLYYVIASFFNCRNLLKDTQGFLRNQLARLISSIRTIDQSSIPASERQVIRVYSVFWLAGRAMALFLLFAVTLPLAAHYIQNLAGAFKVGYSANPSDFVDAVLLATYFLAPFCAGLVLWIGGMVRRERT